MRRRVADGPTIGAAGGRGVIETAYISFFAFPFTAALRSPSSNGGRRNTRPGNSPGSNHSCPATFEFCVHQLILAQRQLIPRGINDPVPRDPMGFVIGKLSIAQ